MNRYFKAFIVLSYSLLFVSAFTSAQDEGETLEPVVGMAFDGTHLLEDGCQILSSNGEEKPTRRDVPGMDVLNRTKTDPLVVFGIENVIIKGVVCWRFPAKFSANDYLVPEKLGYPLYIKEITDNEEDLRTFVLEKINDRFRIRLLSGLDIQPEEKTELVRILSHYEQQIKAGSI